MAKGKLNDDRISTVKDWREQFNVNGRENKCIITGILEKEFEYSHGISCTNFYETIIKVKRKNGVEDLIPVIASDKILKNTFQCFRLKGKYVQIEGNFRSYRSIDEKSKHLRLYVGVEKICVLGDERTAKEDSNIVYLEGRICKPTIFRTTPNGVKITEIMLSVGKNITHMNSIPCITWNNLAIGARKFKINDELKIYGRIQSREYIKRSSPDSPSGEIKTAYEVSIFRIEKCKNK